MNRSRIKVESGKIIAGTENLKRMIRSLNDGEFSVETKVWSGAKTYDQIKAIYGVLIPEYSNYTGMTRDEAKRFIKIEFGETEYFEKDGERFVELKSFADYTKKEMQNFISELLHHLEFDCGMIIDLQTRKRLHIDFETGELVEV